MNVSRGKQVEVADHVREAFTELAPSYANTMNRELITFWGISYSNFVERLMHIAAVKPGEKVLDIATGTAVIPIKLIENTQPKERVVGVDITPAMLRQGSQVIAGNGIQGAIDLVCASAMDMPFANGTFDVVICALGTHHMNVPKMLSEARRLLVKNGRLVISDVGATAFWRSLTGKMLIHILMWEYGFSLQSARSQAELEAFQNVRTAEEWSRLLHDSGYVKVRVDEIKPRLPWYPSGLTLQAQVLG